MSLSKWFAKSEIPQPADDRRLRILTVSISREDAYLLEFLEEQEEWEVKSTYSPREAFELTSCGAFDVILCNRNQPGYPWREVMDRLAASSPDSCIFLVSPIKDDYLWCDVLSHGGFDVLIRPFRSESVARTINQRRVANLGRVECRAEEASSKY